MKRAKSIIAVLLCLSFLSACAAPAANQAVAPPQTAERMLSDVRMQYRDASLILEGVCTGSHIDADGNTCNDLKITEVYAGAAGQSDVVHCAQRDLKQGDSYILFLREGEDVHYAEDVIGYEMLSSSPLAVVDDEVIWGGKRLSVSTLKEEIALLSSEISAPAPLLYYNTLSELANAADEIFIGRVTQAPALSSHSFSIRNGGTVEKARYNASILSVEVYGSVKGTFGSYGQQIEVVYSPERVGGMLDSNTLAFTSNSVRDVPTYEKDGVYLFFLLRGPDSKQSYYFPINPVQGAVKIEGEQLIVKSANSPLGGFATLTQAVKGLHAVLNRVNPGEGKKPLIVE